MAIEVSSKRGAMGIMNDTEGANIVVCASQQESAANAKRLAFIGRFNLPGGRRASLAGVGKHQ